MRDERRCRASARAPLVTRWLMRCALAVAAASAGLTFSFPAYDPFAAQAARAQEPTQVPTDTPPRMPTETPTSSATPTAAPTITQTPTPAPASPTAVASGTAPSTATATPNPTVTPRPTATLTALPTAVATVEAVIDVTGGALTSADGKVTVAFPAGATDELLSVRITPLDPATLPPNFGHHQIALWDFQAFAIDRGLAEVENFRAPLTLTVRLSDADMGGLMSHSLRVSWYDDVTSTWQSLPTQATAHREWTATTTHFSPYGPAADEAVSLPPLANQASVNLNGGSAQLALPIELPPGRAGFAPSLTLGYSSAAVNEMKSRWAMGSWVGIGFNLDFPYITQRTLGDVTHYYLSLNGVSDEIVELPGNRFKLKRESHLKIKKSCQAAPAGQPCWTVIDKAGTVYVFGGTADSYRFWNDEWECFGFPGPCGGNPPPEHPYRWDLSKATDVHGNNYAVAYERVMAIGHWQFTTDAAFGWTAHPYVMASYPTVLTYNQGSAAEVRVEFTTGYDYTHTDTLFIHPYTQTLNLRDDAPVRHGGTPLDPSCNADNAPLVMDTKYLTQIEVLAKNPNLGFSPLERVRRYTFEYEPRVKGCDAAGNQSGSGELKLSGVKLWDRDAANTLYTQTFLYTPKHFAFNASCGQSGAPCDYTRPFLTTYDNGFGGVTQLLFEEKLGGAGTGYWSRQILTRKSEAKGWGDLDGSWRTYSYAGYPDYLGIGGDWTTEFKGYREATETDALGHYTVHKFHTVVAGSPNTYDAREGREYEAASYASGGGAFLVKNELTASTAFSESALTPGVDPVTYVYLSQAKTTLQDGKILQTDYVVSNGTGGACAATAVTCETTQTLERGDTSITTDNRTTEQHVHAVSNDAANLYLIRPKWAKTYAGDGTGGTLSAEAAFYYDGASSYDAAPTKGNLTATRATEKTSPQTTYVCAYTQYDASGNVIRASAPTANPTAATCPAATTSPTGGIPAGVPYSETVYDASYSKFPLTQRQPFVNVPLETTTLAADFDFVLGKPKKTTAPNGNVLEFEYDGFGRLKKSWDSLTSQALPARRVDYVWGAEPNFILVSRRTGVDNEVWELHCYDGFGREVQQVRVHDAFQNVIGGEKMFDTQGRVMKEFLPRLAAPSGPQCYQPSEGSPGATYAYDALGNAKTITDAAGKVTTITRNGLTTTTVDANGHKTETVADAFGRTAAVKEYTGAAAPYAVYGTTSYEYDAPGNLKKVTDELGNQTTISYDMLGRKTSMTDPDMGSWSYAYGPAGSLTSQTDNRGITTTLAYDALERLTGKTYSNGDPGVSFLYDSFPDAFCPQPQTYARGQMTRMTDSAGAQLTCLDIRGRAEKTRRSVDSINYDTTSSYDLANRAVDLTYPDGEVVHHSYSAVHGRLTGVCQYVYIADACVPGNTYLSGASYTAAGMPDLLPLGNGVTTNYDYDANYPARLSRTLSTAGASTKQDLALTYDNVSNVKTVTDSLTAETVTYSYDDLDRLTGATGFAGGQSTLYAYNQIGNLTRKKEGQLDLTLVYPTSGAGAVRPHAATQAKFTGTSTAYKTLAYDQNGNLDYVNSAAESDYTFDAENRVKTRSYGAATTGYVYDGSGAMVKRTTAGAGAQTETTVYVGGLYEKNVTTGVRTTYYMAFGRAIAMRKTGSAGSTLSYPITDHLGGTTGLLDSSGNVTASRKYWPYGAERAMSGDQRATDMWYTGQRDEDYDGLGLYNYNARFYSTVLGRFVSPDPTNPAHSSMPLNRFSYANDNPLRFTDPTGYDPTPEDHDNCARNIVACLWWSAGGDAERYIKGVADWFGVSDDVLGAIVLNEMNSRDLRDSITEPVGTVCVRLGISFCKNASYGVAQIKLTTAKTIEAVAREFQHLTHEEDFVVARLKNPLWAIAYTAALMRYYREKVFPDPAVPNNRDHVVTDADYIVAHRGDWPEWMEAGGCDTCGYRSPAQIKKVRELEVDAVRVLGARVQGLMEGRSAYQ